jgi:hypothetical protein
MGHPHFKSPTAGMRPGIPVTAKTVYSPKPLPLQNNLKLDYFHFAITLLNMDVAIADAEEVLELVRTPRSLRDRPISQAIKYWLGRLARSPGMSARKVALMYGLSHTVICKYQHAEELQTPLYTGGGRPPLLDEIGQAKVMNEISGCMPAVEFIALIDRVVLERSNDNNRALGQWNGTSRQTVKRFILANDLGEGNAEEETKARAEACACPRNALTFAAMNKLMVDKTPPCCILNMDATQFEVGNTQEENVRCVYLKTKRQRGQPLKVEKQEDGDYGGLHFYVKYFLIMTAGGHRADPVFCLADSSMEDGTYAAYRVEGLGIRTTEITATFGWLVMCSTRCCNVEFYKWLNKTIIMPTTQLIKQVHHLPADAHVWLQLDGEAVQIAPYEDPDILKQLAANNISVGKPPGSTTAITQPCDAGNCFKAAKSKLRATHDAAVVSNTAMFQTLNEVLKGHICAQKEKYIKKHGCETGFKSMQSHKKCASAKPRYHLACCSY